MLAFLLTIEFYHISFKSTQLSRFKLVCKISTLQSCKEFPSLELKYS